MAVVIDPPEAPPEAPKPVEILPAVHLTSGMPKNYRVEVARFGGFKRGAILPRHIVVRSAGAGAAGREDEVCNQKVLKRQLSETYDDVNVDLTTIPEAVAPVAVSAPSSISDVKDLEVKISGLRADLLTMQKDRDAWKLMAQSKDTMLQEQQGLIGELRGIITAKEQLIERQKGEIRVMTDTLDAATKPGGKE